MFVLVHVKQKRITYKQKKQYPFHSMTESITRVFFTWWWRTSMISEYSPHRVCSYVVEWMILRLENRCVFRHIFDMNFHSLAVLGSQGCREKKIQTTISMLLLRSSFLCFHGHKKIYIAWRKNSKMLEKYFILG